jgi:hypothetical protein
MPRSEAMSNVAVPTSALLSGIPPVNVPENLRVALSNGRRMSTVLGEVVALRRGPGKLAPSEYFYYRLWEPQLTFDQKRAFVGKQAQHRMHVACNDRHWYQAAADKILFHTIMAGARLPVPHAFAITQAGRTLSGATSAERPEAVAAMLRDPDLYPLFAKPDSVLLLGGERRPVQAMAQAMAEGAGYILEPRLRPAPEIRAAFGPRLWSIRMLVFIRPKGPHIHRAVVKIATGTNPADNFWRPGNMLGAIDLSTGCVSGIVRGCGAEMTRNEPHPDTGQPIIGLSIPDWRRLCDLAREAASVFPGIRTQSWDVAVTDQGPTFLEVNFGGDLNLAQLAQGQGVLDDEYRAHLANCGFTS